MGFNSLTLLSLPFGLILPVAIIIFFCFSKKKNHIAYDSVAYGFGGFLASVVAVFVVFIAMNTLLLSSVKFVDDNSGMQAAGAVIIALIVILFIVCESFKMMTVNKFIKSEGERTLFSSIGYSAGVVIAQNALVFVALNIFNNYEMEATYAIFSGLILFVSSIMYVAVSAATEIMLRDGYKYPAYGVSFVYYLFWIALILAVRSTILMYIITAFFFVVTLVLSGVFFFRSKIKTEGK